MHRAFDRGSVLLHDLPGPLAERLPGIVWDPRIGAHRAAASSWPRIRRTLEECGAELDESEDAAMPASEMASACPVRLQALELRPYQQIALEAWESSGGRGVVVLPTGAGKTRVALAAIAASGVPALVLVPTRMMLDQWVACLAEVHEGPVGKLGDGERTVEPLTVATYESARRHALALSDRFGLLVIDEAHHVGGALRREVLETSLATRRLGLTATPPGPATSRALVELVGPQVLRITLERLEGLYLAPLRLIGVGLDMAPEERASWLGDITVYRAALARHSLDLVGLDAGERGRLLSRTDEGRRALAARDRARMLAGYCRAKSRTLAMILDRHSNDRTLVFTGANATAHAIAREHLIAPITCEVSRSERRDLFAAFASGELRALVSSRVLNEGIDVPDASVGVIVGASRSGREHVQRVGRLLRPAPGKSATLYDLFTLGTGEERAAARRRRALAC